MTEKAFSKGDAIRYGWGAMKANLGFFIGLLVIVGVISIIPNALQRMTAEQAPAQALMFALASMAFNVIITMGLTTISLKILDNRKPELGDLFSRLHLFFRYLGTDILYTLIILGGLILLIVPGIVWGLMFIPWGFVVMDRGLGPIKALEKSAALTRGAKWDLFLFGLLLLGINLLGVVALGIGLFATIPTSLVASAHVYRTLLARAEAPQTISK